MTSHCVECYIIMKWYSRGVEFNVICLINGFQYNNFPNLVLAYRWAWLCNVVCNYEHCCVMLYVTKNIPHLTILLL